MTNLLTGNDNTITTRSGKRFVSPSRRKAGQRSYRKMHTQMPFLQREKLRSPNLPTATEQNNHPSSETRQDISNNQRTNKQEPKLREGIVEEIVVQEVTSDKMKS